MPRPEPPVLDPRTPAELAEELRVRARTSLPEWRPPPTGDVGTVLRDLFGELMGLVVQRINAVPTHALRTFLETAGVGLLPATAAAAPVAFQLVPGAGPTLVPAGTQVVAPARAGVGDVVYETTTDLTVLPVTLAAVVVVDPVWDRFTDLLGRLPSAPDGLSALVGVEPVVHEVHLRSPMIGGTPSDATLEIELQCTLRDVPARVVDEASVLLTSLVVRLNDEAVAHHPSWTVTLSGQTFLRAKCQLPVHEVRDVALVLEGGVTRPAARSILLNEASLTLMIAPRPPAAVVVDGSRVEAGMAFAPFGDVPRPGSQLAIADDAIGLAGADITVSFDVAGGTPQALALAWEYQDGRAWQPLTVVDGTQSFQQRGDVTFVAPGGGTAEVGGVEGHWVRVRITSGGYGTPAEYVPKNNADLNQGLKLKEGSGTLHAPVVLTMTTGAEMVDDRAAMVGRAGWQTAPEHRPFVGLEELGPVDGEAGQALYMGLDGDPSNHPVSIHLEVVTAATTPRSPARGPERADHDIVWEYFDSRAWRALTVEDSTAAMTRPGIVRLIAPPDLAPSARFGREPLWWVRARSTGAVRPSASPVLAGLAVNVVEAVAGQTAVWEPLGQANGQPGQQMRMAQAPILPGQELLVAEGDQISDLELALLTEEEGPDAIVDRTDPSSGARRRWVRWHEVESFTVSGPSNRHYTLDRSSGDLRFGDGRRGLLPPRGTPVVAVYRYGGGAGGNVPPGSITRLRSPRPEIATVTNPGAADGAADPEAAEQVEERGPATLRHRGRAVTAADVSWLARQVVGSRVARCDAPPGLERGDVAIVVVPRDSSPVPRPTASLLSHLERELAARLPLDLVLGTSRLRVAGPAYRTVSVVADIEPERLDQAEAVKSVARARLDEFFNVLTGGSDGDGWPLGRPVFESEVAQVLAGAPGVRNVHALRLAGFATGLRIRFRSAVVLPFGLGAGAAVRSDVPMLVMTLDTPIPPGAPVTSIDVRGPTDGDHVFVLVEASVDPASPVSEAEVVLLLGGSHRWPEDDRLGLFPPGSAVCDGDGAVVAALTDRLRSRTPGAAAGATVQPFVNDLRHRGPLSIAHPFPLRVVQSSGLSEHGTGTLLLCSPGVATLPTGMVLGIPGHPMRIELTSDATAASQPDTLRVETASWHPGQPVTLGAGAGAVTADIADIVEVDDVVYLDAGCLVAPGTHVIRSVSEEMR